ncbi:MAG: hypothetical protein IKM20_00555 [Erysipelotrichales bacterium]|nr:hypothetical protein [Erysipelotrichales bacterium]
MYNKSDKDIQEKINEYIMRRTGKLMEGLDKIVEKVDFLNSDESSRERLIKEYWDYQELKGIHREGGEEKAREFIKIMFSNDFTAEQIASTLNLELDYVEKALNS